MARLFVTEREMNFISDISKEIVKDVIGQAIYLYPISEIRTNAHGVYNEAMKKVFDNPIIIDAIVDAVFQQDTVIDSFGVDQRYKLEVFVQYRDLIDKGIKVNIGDFFSFNDVMYEIVDSVVLKNIFGFPEHRNSIKLTGTKAREGLIDALMLGPTDLMYSDDDATKRVFEQQRGQAENVDGETGDVRELQKAGVLERPLSGQQRISEEGAVFDNSHYAKSFYGEK